MPGGTSFGKHEGSGVRGLKFELEPSPESHEGMTEASEKHAYYILVKLRKGDREMHRDCLRQDLIEDLLPEIRQVKSVDLIDPVTDFDLIIHTTLITQKGFDSLRGLLYRSGHAFAMRIFRVVSN